MLNLYKRQGVRTRAAASAASERPNVLPILFRIVGLGETAQRIASVWFGLLLCSASVPAFSLVCADTTPEGVVLVTAGTPGECTALVLLTESDYGVLRNPFNATPDFDVVLWAFGAASVLWAIGIGIGMLISIVRKAQRS